MSRPASVKARSGHVTEVVPLDVESRREANALELSWFGLWKASATSSVPPVRPMFRTRRWCSRTSGWIRISIGIHAAGEQALTSASSARGGVVAWEEYQGSVQDRTLGTLAIGMRAAQPLIPSPLPSPLLSPSLLLFSHHSIRSRIRFSKPSSPGS